MLSLEFFIDIILPTTLCPWGRLSLQKKWVPGMFPGGYRQPVRRADNLTIFTCRFSWNLGASTSWNPQGLSRPVMGLLYLLHQHINMQRTAYSRGKHTELLRKNSKSRETGFVLSVPPTDKFKIIKFMDSVYHLKWQKQIKRCVSGQFRWLCQA